MALPSQADPFHQPSEQVVRHQRALIRTAVRAVRPLPQNGLRGRGVDGRGTIVFGIGWAELLIIGLVLMIMIGIVVGVVVIASSLARRRAAVAGRPAQAAEPDAAARDGETTPRDDGA